MIHHKTLIAFSALSTALAFGACGSSADVPEAIDEADSVVVVSDTDAGGEYLRSDRDPEGDGLQGEPVGEAPEGEDYESINENRDGNDPIETANRDADPSE